MASTPATFADNYPQVVVAPSQPAITRIMDGDTAPRRLDLQLRATTTGIGVYHANTRIGDTDPADATELHRRIPRLAEGVTVTAVIFQADRRWHIRYNTTDLYRDHPIDPQTELQRFVTAATTSLQQIQRWTGWLVALVVTGLVLTFVFGVNVAVTEPDSRPVTVIMQDPNPEVRP